MQRRIAPIILLLFLTACGDTDLQKIAKGLDITAQSISIVQTTAIDGATLGLITEATTRQILELCIEVNKAGKDSVAITRTLSKLDNPSKSQLLDILKPVIAAVQRTLEGGLLGVTDPATKDRIRLALLTVQSTLNSIQLILATGGAQ